MAKKQADPEGLLKLAFQTDLANHFRMICFTSIPDLKKLSEKQRASEWNKKESRVLCR